MKKILFLLLPIYVNAATYSYNNTQVALLNSESQNVWAAGDDITLLNGTWTGNMILNFRGNGTAAQPITIHAQTPGSVILTGGSVIQINGDYNIVSGLLFQSGPWNLANNAVVLFGSGSDGSRLTNTVIDNYNHSTLITTGSPKYWINMQGKYNRVDHCEFINKRDLGPVINMVATANKFYQVDNCLFGLRTTIGKNGNEDIRIGSGAGTNSIPVYATVNDNVFKDFSADQEVISNKCSYNTFRHNTFINSTGAMTLRACSNSQIRDNFFLNGAAGVKVHGGNQQIVNNYFEGLTGSGLAPALVFMEGSFATGCGYLDEADETKLPPAKNIRVDSNTFSNCTQFIATGYDYGGSSGRVLDPSFVSYTGNIFQFSTVGRKLDSLITHKIIFDYASNFYHSVALDASLLNATGWTSIDPLLVDDGDGVKRISLSSPAAIRALDTTPKLIYSQTSTIVPITEAEIGVTWTF